MQQAALSKVHPELQEAYRLLDAGDADAARKLARVNLVEGEQGRDPYQEAEALLCLALCDRLSSSFRRSYEASQRAAQIFQTIGNARRESAALSVLSYAAGSMGRNEEAVEASLLALRVGDDAKGETQRVLALNYLSIAYYWSRDFARSEEALVAAFELANEAGSHSSRYQLGLNLCFLRILSAAFERGQSGQLPVLDKLRDAVELTERFCIEHERRPMLHGTYLAGSTMWEAILSMHLTWCGNHEGAALHLAAAREQMRGSLQFSWLGSLIQWAEAESLWARGRTLDAELATALMLDKASQVENEQMASLAHEFAAYMLTSRGHHELALMELRKLQRREHRVRTESLSSRARIVDWQIAVRSSERDAQNLRAASEYLERLSLEDPLTKIANRRCFEGRLQAALNCAEMANPTCVALIDVDRFKAVNDSFSHQVGDQVLVIIARLLEQNVRSTDLVGRLAGDEFVVLFERCELAHAEEVCERTMFAVRNFEWSSIASGLAVTISIGVAQTQAGDTSESALHRSDLAMYRTKRNCHLKVSLSDDVSQSDINVS